MHVYVRVCVCVRERPCACVCTCVCVRVVLTCAGDGGRVAERAVVAVLAVAAPWALAVVEAVGGAAGALEVLGGRLEEPPAARWGPQKKKEIGWLHGELRRRYIESHVDTCRRESQLHC